MVKLTEEQKKDDLVKSLLDSGFSEELVAEWIDKGDIKLKSVDDEDDDDDSEEEETEETETEETKPADEEETDEEDEAKKGKKNKGCDGKKEDITKSISDDLLKSIEDKFAASKDEIVKSLPALITEALKPVVDSFEKSISELRESVKTIGDVAPAFKSAGISQAFLHKSINGGAVKDADNKTVLSISKDRQIVRELISKSIEEEKDAELQKSLRDNTNAYLLDPVEGMIGEPAARYFYDKKNVRLVQ